MATRPADRNHPTTHDCWVVVNYRDLDEDGAPLVWAAERQTWETFGAATTWRAPDLEEVLPAHGAWAPWDAVAGWVNYSR